MFTTHILKGDHSQSAEQMFETGIIWKTSDMPLHSRRQQAQHGLLQKHGFCLTSIGIGCNFASWEVAEGMHHASACPAREVMHRLLEGDGSTHTW